MMFRFTSPMLSSADTFRAISGSTRGLTVGIMWGKEGAYFDMEMISERPEVYLDLEVKAIFYLPPSLKRFGVYDAPSSFRFEVAGVSQCPSY